jgi:hypothetical protein
MTKPQDCSDGCTGLDEPGLSVETIEDLQALQREFFRIIRRPLQNGRDMHPVEGLEKFVLASETLTSHERLELYAQQYWWRLQRVMRVDFSVTQTFLTPALFQQVITNYLSEFPSRYPRLKRVGIMLPSFLRETPLLTEYQRSVASSIACVELAKIKVQHEGELPLLTLEALERSGSSVKVRLQPFVQLLELPRAVEALFEESAEDACFVEASNSEAFEETTEGVDAKSRVLPIHAEVQQVAVHRSGLKVKVTRLSPLEAFLGGIVMDSVEIETVVSRMMRENITKGETLESEFYNVFSGFAQRGWLAYMGE